MTNGCGDNLRKVTRRYWQYEADLGSRLKWYIDNSIGDLDGKSLLQAELTCAEKAGRISAKPCNTLVFLVGYSLEPLLQSVCVYKPKKVVLLLNEQPYQMGKGKRPKKWHAFARHLVETIELLVKQGLLDRTPEFPGEKGKTKGFPVADSPEAIFQKLVEILQDEQDVVIDVTGGKKSMVSGAYLYAAYAGTRISYVDFDEYDPDYRRPYGFSCKIGGIANPYEAFALREWERVRDLYERYQFREAKRVLEQEIQPATQHWQPKAVEAVEQLGRIFEFYEKWDSGDFRGAYEYSDLPAGFPRPDAVTKLGPIWYEIADNNFGQKPKHFYGDSEAVKIYACDELARIWRMIKYNEDYRSAFLRAGGLNEIVMLTRVSDLVTDPVERESLLDPLDVQTPSARRVFNALLDPSKTHIDVKKDIPFRDAPNLSISHPAPMNPWWKSTNLFNADDGWRTFLDRRNELIHKYSSVPQEWAKDALAFVQANVEDFWGRTVDEMGVRTTALPWPDICERTGIGKFLPPNLRKEAQS